jgi:uncharacterized membrane protein YidH (DUF202 family)
MIARYTDHAANERTFLAWIRTGLAVAAFGFFIVKLNVLLDAIGDGSPPHPVAENAGAFAAVAPRYAGLAMVAIGIPSSDEAAPALSARAARSIAMRLSRCRSPVRSRYFRWHLRSPW